MVYSIKELAEMVPPGVLGMQYTQAQLLFRPQSEFDPRIKLLLEGSWFEVKGADGVIQAFPTLEAYNELTDSGLEFSATRKAMEWRYGAQNPLPKEDFGNWIKHTTLFDYQKDGARFLTTHDRAMLSLSPGLGKTLTSAYAAGIRRFSNVLVVCPASLLYYWKSELEKWSDKLPATPFISVWHRKIGDFAIDSSVAHAQNWVITNPETVTKNLDELYALDFDCLIVDESIMYKHKNSQRSKALKELAEYIQTVWLLTGAPATRFLDDMWYQFHILKPKGYSSYWRFARKYCVVNDNQWGSKVVANKRNAEKEIQHNFADIYFARSQDDVADIPDWIFEDVDIPMLPVQDKIYEKLRKEFLIELGPLKDNEVIKADNHLSLMIRSIQIASNPLLVDAEDSSGKWNALPELMDIYPGPSIVWCVYIKTGEMLRDKLSKLGKRVVLANGSTPMKDRNEMVNVFQAGEVDAIVMNNQVGKFGFTLTKAKTAFFLERDYSDSYFQCLHRNRRIGTTQSPIIVNMRSVTQKGKKTLDHIIGDTQDYRTGMIKKVTAGMLRKVLE